MNFHEKIFKRAANLARWVPRTNTGKTSNDLIAHVKGRARNLQLVDLLQEKGGEDTHDHLILLVSLGQGMVEGVEVGRCDQNGALETWARKLVRPPELGHVVVPDQHANHHRGTSAGTAGSNSGKKSERENNQNEKTNNRKLKSLGTPNLSTKRNKSTIDMKPLKRNKLTIDTKPTAQPMTRTNKPH